ncbi:TolC family outer membrane protein [Sphingomicrobium lutaoense]|uniref:Outer membrane protein n=1 Tax=Sphingomicrobium lutaoense TaxID=515949 RepID=A0A839YZR6_9SPHN|nr:TolC family outer membrane protein [Sphingomicrobium lutaoense]MBB3763267.1 outer membrane protein [Sphingomicrobium lutaoense]
MSTRMTMALALLAAAATPASADTLQEALAKTYATNPTLNAQREALQATDAGVAIARAGGRPTVTGSASLTRTLSQTGSLTRQSLGPFFNSSVDLNLPLFQGGTVRNDIKAAKERVRAGRATLRAVEGDLFVEAVAAYMDVIRDRATVELNRNQVEVLSTNLQATSDRFEIGDLTRTDVAQSEARLQLAQSSLLAAQSRLAASVENYRRVIGDMPDDLAPPPPLPPLPDSADEAVRIALVDNPDLLAATRQAEAAGYDVRSTRGSRWPTLSAFASGQYLNTLAGDVGFNPFTQASNPRSATATSAGLSARVPFYQGGLPSARVRRARALEGQALEQIIATERFVVAETRSAFAAYEAAVQAIEANEVAVQANALALEGARLENSIGSRSILDVLNAEQEFLNSRVALVTAQRDAYVAGFRLLNVMGQAEAADLNLDAGALYDPLGNYRRIANDWNDWAGEGRHPIDSTRTVQPQEEPVPPPPAITQGVTQGDQ